MRGAPAPSTRDFSVWCRATWVRSIRPGMPTLTTIGTRGSPTVAHSPDPARRGARRSGRTGEWGERRLVHHGVVHECRIVCPSSAWGWTPILAKDPAEARAILAGQSTCQSACSCGWTGGRFHNRAGRGRGAAANGSWVRTSEGRSVAESIYQEWLMHAAPSDALPEIAEAIAARESARRKVEQDVVLALRAGATWNEVADVLGLDVDAAVRRYGHLLAATGSDERES
jgi:hypothetical protein